MKALRSVWTFTAWMLLGLLVGVLIAIAAPPLLGYSSLTVMSGSMHPTLSIGDLVIDEQISPAEAGVGDIVTFQDPDDSSVLITHRVREVSVKGDQVTVVTKGDANNTEEEWTMRADGDLGRVRFHLKKVGFLLVFIRLPIARVLLIALPVLLLAAYEVRRIWSASPEAGGPAEQSAEV